jgi:GDSL-like lipase/acylhydrolase family protein
VRARRRTILYAAYLALCAELTAKVLFLLPAVRARLPPELEVSWRARWVGRYLFTDRTVFYGFDDYHPRLGWTLRKGLRGFRQFAGSTVSSNSRGARGVAEHEPGPHPGRLRVVALGDSFTFGEGVADEQAYPQRLQELLGGSAEVVNLGVHGYGHDQMLIRLREEGLGYAPDLVLLGFYADDAARNLLAFRDYAKPRFVLRGGALALTGSPVPEPRRALLREALHLHAFELLAIPWRRRRAAEERARGQDALMGALLDEMRAAAERAGARFAIVDLPPVAEVQGAEEVAPSEKLLLEYAGPRGVPVCRTRAALRALPPSAPRLHYDAAQHSAVAGALARCLSAMRDQGTNSSSSQTFWKKIRNSTEFARWNTSASGSSTRRARAENSTRGNASSNTIPVQATAAHSAGWRASAYPHEAAGSAVSAWLSTSRWPRMLPASSQAQPVVNSFDQPAKK